MAYYCKHCGFEHNDLKYLLSCGCSKSPTKKHVVYEGNTTNPFICKHCGYEHRDLKYLVSCGCSKSPTRYHEPL